MNVGNTVFSQLMSLIPDYELRKCIDRYRGNFHARRFTCHDQFLVMSYAPFTSSASFRSIEVGDFLLLIIALKIYHIEQNLYIFSNVIGQVLFERTPLNDLFVDKLINKNPEYDRQLSLW